MKVCVSCNEEQPYSRFSKSQRRREDGKCHLCSMKKCSLCHRDIHVSLFDEVQREREDGTCNECIKPTSKQCGSCHEEKPLTDFSNSQRKKCDDAQCKACREKLPVDAPMKVCVSCNEEQPYSRFSKSQRRREDGKCHLCSWKKCSLCHRDIHVSFFNEVQREQEDGACNECIKPTSKQCGSCNEEKPLADFSNSQRKKCEDAQCKACCGKLSMDRPMKVCVSCNEEKNYSRFSKSQRTREDGKCRLCSMKKCSLCHRDFHYSLFNETQREREDGACNECITREEEILRRIREAEVERQNAEIASVPEGIQLRRLRCERYELPDDDQLQIPSIKDIVGAYDIIYYYASVHEDVSRTLATYAARGLYHGRPKIARRQRTTRGMLMLKMITDPDTKDSVMSGIVNIDPKVIESTDSPLIGDFLFRQSDDILSEVLDVYYPYHGVSVVRNAERSIPLDVLPIGDKFSEDVECYGVDNEMIGQLMTVSQSIATRLISNEYEENYVDELDDLSYTISEANELVKEAKDEFLQKSWLSNHMVLPKEVAWLVHQYVTFWPPPVFCFEKDDLWLNVIWGDNFKKHFYHTIVARRRQVK